MTGVKIDAFANDVNADGSTGYYSVFYVQGDSPYKKHRGPQGQEPRPGRSELDLRQQRAALRAEQDGHRDADTYFGKVVYTGSHENAVLALAQGTVDVAANQWNADDDSTLAHMLTKGMLKNADGSVMKKDDFRIIFKSDADPQRAPTPISPTCRTT